MRFQRKFNLISQRGVFFYFFRFVNHNVLFRIETDPMLLSNRLVILIIVSRTPSECCVFRLLKFFLLFLFNLFFCFQHGFVHDDLYLLEFNPAGFRVKMRANDLAFLAIIFFIGGRNSHLDCFENFFRV